MQDRESDFTTLNIELEILQNKITGLLIDENIEQMTEKILKIVNNCENIENMDKIKRMLDIEVPIGDCPEKVDIKHFLMQDISEFQRKLCLWNGKSFPPENEIDVVSALSIFNPAEFPDHKDHDEEKFE